MTHPEHGTVELDVLAELPARRTAQLEELIAGVNRWLRGVADSLRWRVPPVRVVLTDDFDQAVVSSRPVHIDAEVVRERLGGRVAGKTFFTPNSGCVCIVEVQPDEHDDDLAYPLLVWTIMHELGHALLLQACEDHGDRDLGRLLGDDPTCRQAALTAHHATDEWRCDLLAGMYIKEFLSVTLGDADRQPITAEFLLGDSYGEGAVAHLDMTSEDVLDAVWTYRLTGEGLDELWPRVWQHFDEVLVLQAHARAVVPDSPALTSPAFTDHPVGSRIDECWAAIVTALSEGGALPHADDWPDRQRRLAIEGGAAVVELYRTIGILPEEQPDGSLYVHVVDPAVAPLPDA
jgi:hypothetical protein